MAIGRKIAFMSVLSNKYLWKFTSQPSQWLQIIKTFILCNPPFLSLGMFVCMHICESKETTAQTAKSLYASKRNISKSTFFSLIHFQYCIVIHLHISCPSEVHLTG